MRNARPGSSGRFAFPLVLFTLLVGITGCSRDEAAYEPNADEYELRIVSFMPSATRIVVDLGLGDRIVGVAEHDAAAPAINADGDPMPIVGHFMDVDVERLISLGPTHVIFPTSSSRSTAALDDLTALGAQVVETMYPTTIDEAVISISEIGQALGKPERGKALSARVGAEIDKQRQFLQVVEHIKSAFDEQKLDGKIPSTETSMLLAFSVDPVMASGPGSINHELIVLAGAINAVGDASVSAVTLDREALIDANPTIILLMLPGSSDAEVQQKVAWFDGLPIDAVEHGHIHAITDPQVLLPASNLPETLGVIREISDAVRREPPSLPTILEEPTIER